MVAFSIVTLKVDGTRDDGKRARIFECLRLLQETHFQAEDFEGWSAEWRAGLLLES